MKYNKRLHFNVNDKIKFRDCYKTGQIFIFPGTNAIVLKSTSNEHYCVAICGIMIKIKKTWVDKNCVLMLDEEAHYFSCEKLTTSEFINTLTNGINEHIKGRNIF